MNHIIVCQHLHFHWDCMRLYEAEKQTTLKVILTFILSVCKAMYLYYWYNTTTGGSITPLPSVTRLYCTIQQNRHIFVNHIFYPPKKVLEGKNRTRTAQHCLLLSLSINLLFVYIKNWLILKSIKRKKNLAMPITISLSLK